MNAWNEETMYLVANVASASICIVFGLLLMDMRGYMRYIRETPVFPERYIVARRTLGIACLIIGCLTAFQIIAGASGKTDEFLPFSGLMISSSQAMLFTGALLSLYNSRILRKKIVWLNIIPVMLFIALYAALYSQPDAQMIVRKIFFAFYVIQLIAYSVVFFEEREKYHSHLDNQFADNSYRAKSVTVLFICSLAVGIAAMSSYFFTELWQLTAFIASYTVYYGVVAVYFLNYVWRSRIIEEVTSPEKWSKEIPEEVKKIMAKETKRIKN